MSRARNARRAVSRRTTEYDEQCVVIEWCDRFVVEWSRDRFAPLGRFVYAVPNGEVLNSHTFTNEQRMARIGRLRRSGFRRGACDLIIDLPRGVFHGARLEMKANGNRPEPHQAVFMATLLEAGYHVGWADGAGDAIAWLMQYCALGLFDAGRPTGAALGTHRPEIAGSIPAPATIALPEEVSHG